MLLYLNNRTFSGTDGEILAGEIREARTRGYEIVLVHENDEALGGCPFARCS
jgi:hypothetical protein